ncbi:MAG: DNA polymerase-3 subunit delta [Myxococcota bacterium]|jgi:DNA polymerase-3 subunit delta
MTLLALDQSLKAGLKPVYIVQGTEQLLVDEAVTRILAAAVSDPSDTLAVTRVDLAEGKIAARDIVAACRSIGLFTPRIAVVVRAAELLDKKAPERDEVARYVQKPVEGCTLILRATKLNGSTALVKRTKKVGLALSFTGLRARDAVGWVRDRASMLKHRMDYAAAQLVVELVGTDLLRLQNTMEQLSLFAGTTQPITQELVEKLLTATRSHSVFELVDAVGERRAADALRHLDAMLGHREPPLKILGMVTRHFRFLWQIGELQATGAASEDIVSRLGLHPFQAKKMAAQTRLFNGAVLRHAYERLYETDLQLKSTRHDGSILMERLVLDLCGAAVPRAPTRR